MSRVLDWTCGLGKALEAERGMREAPGRKVRAVSEKGSLGGLERRVVRARLERTQLWARV